jgi:ABC-type branched-subunit amino acid transport system ATPase component
VILGTNGAGKSTLAKAITGTCPASTGPLVLDGGPLDRVARGVLLVPGGRGVFPGLNVEDNLRLVLPSPAARDTAFERFPILRDRRTLPAGSLSGGE